MEVSDGWIHCVLCDATFADKRSLRRHYVVAHHMGYEQHRGPYHLEKDQHETKLASVRRGQWWPRCHRRQRERRLQEERRREEAGDPWSSRPAGAPVTASERRGPTGRWRHIRPTGVESDDEDTTLPREDFCDISDVSDGQDVDSMVCDLVVPDWGAVSVQDVKPGPGCPSFTAFWSLYPTMPAPTVNRHPGSQQRCRRLLIEMLSSRPSKTSGAVWLAPARTVMDWT